MTRSIRVVLLATVLMGVGSFAPHAAFDSTSINSQKHLTLTRITPDGEDVASARQIVIQFSRPVVPVGRMERSEDEIPIEISPRVACQWRWLNTSALACQLNDKDSLSPSTRYRLTLRATLAAEDGTLLDKDYEHEFVTKRPTISYARFRNWSGPGFPTIQLPFDQPVTRASVLQHVFLEYSDNGTRQRVTLEPSLDKASNERRNARTQHLKVDAERLLELDASDNWLVEPVRPLPLDTSVELKVSPGLVSALGPEKSVQARTVVKFDTYPEFEFLGVECRTQSGDTLFIPAQANDDARRCAPEDGVRVQFSAPVLYRNFGQHVDVEPSLAAGHAEGYDPWARYHAAAGSRLYSPHARGRRYGVALPEALAPFRDYKLSGRSHRSENDDGTKSVTELTDQFSRSLTAPLAMAFQTDHFRPDFNLTYHDVVLESQIDSEPPFGYVNLNSVSRLFNALLPDDTTATGERALEIAEATDVRYRVPLGIRELLDNRSGAVHGTIASVPGTRHNYAARYFFAQVTPYHVHAKLGHFASVAWLTDLATGEPVRGADVEIYVDTIANLSAEPEILSSTRSNRDGIAKFPGSRELDPQLTYIEYCRARHRNNCPRLFVRVRKGDNLAVLPLENRFAMPAWRASQYQVNSRQRKIYGHARAWGTTAQGVYRAGDTIAYKLYVRDQSNEQFVLPPLGTYRLEIKDPTGKIAHQVDDIELSAFGAYDGEFSVDENAATGWYRFELHGDYTEYNWQPLRVLVTDFTPTPFKVVSQINGETFFLQDEIEIDSQALLHSGGAYPDAALRVTAKLAPAYFRSKHPLARNFGFASPGSYQPREVYGTTGVLDDSGSLTHSFTIDGQGMPYGRVSVESAVRDDRGKYIADRASAEYFGASRLVGLKARQWTFEENKPAHIDYIVVDEHGSPVSAAPVEIAIAYRQVSVAKVKGAGNAYLNQYKVEMVDVAKCEGTSKADAPMPCAFTPQNAGYYLATATTTDDKDRKHQSIAGLYVVGQGHVVWQAPDDNSLQLVPQRDDYAVGEVARYLVKNPFPGANALITIERYGILKQWVETFDTSTPIVEFKLDQDMVPGAYLSVVVMTPRVDAPPPKPGEVDLGKPAVRMGYATLKVADPYKQIDVAVNTDKEIYKPGDKVAVTLNARPKHRGRKEPIELAVVVLDEAVLDLVQGRRSYYDPYDGFYSLDSLDVTNYNLLERLIGRQSFGKKGANPGGGGGSSLDVRSVFKYVAYWNPALATDRRGNARFELTLPDNLTGWRVLAMAVTPTDRMGLGDVSFKTNLPTEIRPTMPNQVMEGDRFKAGFTVMNRTDETRTIAVDIKADGTLTSENSFSQSVVLPPYKRSTVLMPVKAGSVARERGRDTGQIEFIVSAFDDRDRDGLKFTLPVNKRRSFDTAATYGTTVGAKINESILFPQGIYTDVGQVEVVLAPSVIGNTDGAFRYMQNYPYSCWEQQLTKAVMASHFQNLKPYFDDATTWPGSDALPPTTLSLAAHYQAPNGGMTYYIARDEYVSPYLSAYTALAFNWLADSGYSIPSTVQDKLHEYLLTLLRRDVMPTFYSDGMASTVRAVALSALARHKKVTGNDLQRYATHVPQMSLFGKAHYLQAVVALGHDKAVADEVTGLILSHAVQSGGKFVFNETMDAAYQRILASPMRANCAVLSNFLAQENAGDASIADIPFKLVRTITQTRGQNKNRGGYWENTQENVFCMNALVEYARIYETQTPNSSLRVALDEDHMGTVAFSDIRDAAVTLSRPINDSDKGARRTLSIERTADAAGSEPDSSRFYYAARLAYAPLIEHSERVNAGIDVRKEYSVERDGEWELLEQPMAIRRGELVRVDIYMSLPTARNFVVIDDPVPGGLEPVNRDLATTSLVDADKGTFKAADNSFWYRFGDWRSYRWSRWSFYHQELHHDAARFYSDYLPPGRYHVSYTAQAIAEGEFAVMPVHSEEMYDPDIYGKGLPRTLTIEATSDAQGN